MRKGLKAVAAGMAIISMGTLAACKHHHGHDQERLKEHVQGVLKKIGATEQQRDKIDPILDRIAADAKQLHESGRPLAKKFVACLLLDTPNREWLHKTVDEKAKEFTAFAHRTVDSLIEISGTLDSQQRAELKKRIESAHGDKQ